MLVLGELTWAGVGAICAGVGSMLSGIATYKLAGRQSAHIDWEEEHAPEPEAGGADS